MPLFIEIDEYELRGDSIWILDCAGDERFISTAAFAKWCPVSKAGKIEVMYFVKNKHGVCGSPYEPEYDEKFDLIDFTDFMTEKQYAAAAKQRLQQFINQ